MEGRTGLNKPPAYMKRRRKINNRSTTDPIFCVRQIFEGKKWEYNEILYQLFVGFKKAYDSVWGGFLDNILIWFGVPMKLVGLIKM